MHNIIYDTNIEALYWLLCFGDLHTLFTLVNYSNFVCLKQAEAWPTQHHKNVNGTGVSRAGYTQEFSGVKGARNLHHMGDGLC